MGSPKMPRRDSKVVADSLTVTSLTEMEANSTQLHPVRRHCDMRRAEHSLLLGRRC